MRIGHGFDVHAFGGEGPIIIGGVRVPYEKGLLAHSDGDVALHALTDALLGAAARPLRGAATGAGQPDGDLLRRRVLGRQGDGQHVVADPRGRQADAAQGGDRRHHHGHDDGHEDVAAADTIAE